MKTGTQKQNREFLKLVRRLQMASALIGNVNKSGHLIGMDLDLIHCKNKIDVALQKARTLPFSHFD